MIFDCTDGGDPLFKWDYPRHLIQHLAWAKRTYSQHMHHDWSAFFGALIGRCTDTDGFDWRALDVDQVAMACAIRLIALMHQFEPSRYGAGDEANVGDKVVSVVRTLVGVTLENIQQDAAASPAAQAQSRFASLVGPCFMLTLGTPIHTVTTHPRPNPPLPDVIACPSTAFNLFLDSMLVLGRTFTVSHIHCVPAAVFAWTNLDISEYADQIRRMSVNCAIGLLRAAVEVVNEDAIACIVRNIPSERRDSDQFLRGLGAIVRMWPDRRVHIERALDWSRWDAWQEKMAKFVDVPPQANGVAGVADESGECSGDEFDLFDEF